MYKSIMLELISSCNLSCKMCAFKSNMTGEVLNREMLDAVVADIKKLKNSEEVLFERVRFDGNTEPLVYKDIIPVINKFGCELPDIQVEMITNGVLLDRDISHSLLSANISVIHISITGITTKVYREFQGSNLPEHICEKNFLKVTENIQNLIRLKRELCKKTIIEVRYIMSDVSREEFIPYMSYWRKEGADRVYLSAIGNSNLESKPRALGKVIGYKQCFLFGNIVIKSSGEIFLSCCNYQMKSVGNLNKASFFDIMTSEKVVKQTEAFEAVDIDIANIPSICLNCPNIHIYE